MENIIGLNGDFRRVPFISPNLDQSEVHQLIPDGFEDLISFAVNSITGDIELTLENDESENSIINIPKTIYNPQSKDVTFPKFLIEQEFRNNNVDYFDPKDGNRYIFNQNELLWITLQHRLTSLSSYKVVYANLIMTDISQIKDFQTNSPFKAYNAIQKEKYSYLILSIFDNRTKMIKYKSGNNCIGNILKTKDYKVNSIALSALLHRLPLRFTAESNGEKSKYTLCPYPEEIFRSVGLKTFIDPKTKVPHVTSLFKSAQNLPSRYKTHITADATVIADFKPTSVFAQDYLPNSETRTYSPKDECYKEAICVIHPFTQTGKFLFGEIEASVDVNRTPVIVRESITALFHDDHMYFDIGETKQASNKGSILVGKDIEGKPVVLSNCISAKLETESYVGAFAVRKLVFSVKRCSGNARIDSNTGLKGVTKCKPNLGVINFDNSNLSKLKPDLVFGMNSFKAKGNSIILARAALAVKLGTYKPKHFSGLLNTLDEDEINKASESLPDYHYIDEFGEVIPVQIGVVYYRYTELCTTYTSWEKQKFSFECGRVLHSLPDKTLFNAIWDNYIDPDRLGVVLEFQKILEDRESIFDSESLPVYTPKYIIEQKIFKTTDLVTSVISSGESNSKLLDEEFNKGFIINFTNSPRGFYLRIPPASMLNMYCTETDDRMYMYPRLLVLISRIIQYILENRLGLLFPREFKNGYTFEQTPVGRYYSEVKGLLYTSPEASVMMVQTLSRPEVTGFAGKQTVEPLLPPGVVLIMDDNLYNKVYEYISPKERGTQLYGLHARSPF